MATYQNKMTIGIDVGGTFTDLLALDHDTGELTALKMPSTAGELARGVVNGLEQLPKRARHSTIIHGTTVATNAVLEGRGARTALIVTRNFRDLLEIGRQSRENMYDLREHGRPPAMVPRHLRLEITERMDPNGAVLQNLKLDEVSGILKTLQEEKVEAIAVSLLNAYANPDHERALFESIHPHFPFVSISTEINAEFREYERTNTVVLNAFVMPLVHRYVERLLKLLHDSGWQGRLHFVQSNGGMISGTLVKRQPLCTVMSGPAAGVAAAQHLMEQLDIRDGITFDMGGTSTDVCLIPNGQAAETAERRIGGQPVRFASVAIESIGAGGGSIAWVDAAGAMKVGPHSAGALPGPACYDRGGKEPTVTDANLLLGYLNPAATFGRQINLQYDLAEKAVGRFGDKFDMSLLEAAQGIIDIANANMIHALRLVSVQKGHDLRRFVLVAFGGAGPLHAGRLARMLHIPKVIVPPFSSGFSALGCLVSDVRIDSVLTYRRRLDDLTAAELAEAFLPMEKEARRRLMDEGYAVSEIELQHACDLRYVGQKYELTIPLAGDPQHCSVDELHRRYQQRHEALYAYITAEPVECINLRLVAQVPRQNFRLPPRSEGHLQDARVAEREAFFPETGQVSIPVYQRERLGSDVGLQGPAIFEDEWSTTLVYPGQYLQVDQSGALIIEENP